MARKITVDFELKYKEASKNLDEFQKEYSKLEAENKKLNSGLNETSNLADKATGGLISKFKGVTGTLKGVTGGFKTLRGAIISTGIGALVIAVTSLIAAFKSSEEGQNKLNKIMTIFGSIVGNLTDKVSDLGEFIIGIFENPKQAFEDFKKLVLDNLTNRFNGLLELIPNLGKAITQLFKGNFKEAGTIAANAVAKVTLGVDDIVGKTKEAIEATKEFIKEIEQEAKVASNIADMRAKADKQERELLVERAKANRDIAELREKAADKENVSVKERIEALKEAGRIEEEITNKEIENARLRFEAKAQENALSKSTKEDLDEEARLKAALLELETARLTKQKALTAELTTATREANAELKEMRDAQAAYEDEQRKKQAEQDAKDLKDKEDRAKKEIELEKQKRDAKFQTLNNAIFIAGQESKVGKALFLAKQALLLQEIISEAQKTITFSSLAAARSSAAVAEGTAQTAKIGFPQNIPMLIGYAAQAVGIIGAIKSATGQANSIAGRFGRSSSTPTITEPLGQSSTPPDFNIVGGSAANQLAEVVGGGLSRPVKAYVVSKDVSTAQEMDRNVVDGASLG